MSTRTGRGKKLPAKMRMKKRAARSARSGSRIPVASAALTRKISKCLTAIVGALDGHDDRAAVIALLCIVIHRALHDKVDKQEFLETLGGHFDFYVEQAPDITGPWPRVEGGKGTSPMPPKPRGNGVDACVHALASALSGFDMDTISRGLICITTADAIARGVSRKDFVDTIGNHYDAHAPESAERTVH